MLNAEIMATDQSSNRRDGNSHRILQIIQNGVTQAECELIERTIHFYV
jgi:hypothetical protein